VVASEGLYGPPSNNYQPTTGGFWGTFWNAVSAVVTNPLGAALSLVDTVWNAGTAAFTYLNHLAHEAAALGAEVVARTAAAIVHAGQVIASALERFLSYLLQLVADLLEPVTQPISNSIKGYVWNVEAAVGKAQNDTTTNGTLAPGDARAVWSALSGSVFLFALGLCAVVTIGLTILSSVDIGPSFVVDLVTALLIGTLVGVASQALISSVESAFTSVSSEPVYSLEGFFNSTVGTEESSGAPTFEAAAYSSSQSSWTTAALLVSACVEFQLAWPLDLFALLKDTERSSGLVGAVIGGTISLAFDITGIVLFIAGLTEPAPLALLILGLAVGIYSYVGAFGALQDARDAVPPDPDLASLLEFDTILQTINLGSAAYATEQAASQSV